jgi:phenylpyruvate tautomerase PptA (4-oxalocrotonate tautomerase family)
VPLYTCIADSRTTTAERQAIARAITDTHCGHTGAPPEFVHVIFNEFLGRSAAARIRIVGTIRSGRDATLKATIQAELVAKAAAILAAPPALVQVSLQDIPAEWAMEGGEVLPAPGAEHDWMAARRDTT